MTIDWPRIEQFIGYGNIGAPVVFVGMEEGLADPNALSDDLLFRSTFARVIDVERAHRGLAGGATLFSDKPRRQPTWRVMADVMLHYEHVRFTSPKERAQARRQYRTKKLGRETGESLFIELLPYPSKRTSTWLYSMRFPTRAAYKSAVLPNRLALISQALSESQRAAIICYGRADWDAFRALFPADTRWKAVDRFECATWNGAKVTLTDHFASKYFNTDVQLDGLAMVALQT